MVKRFLKICSKIGGLKKFLLYLRSDTMRNFRTNDVLIRKFKEDDVDKVYKHFNSSDKISNLSNIIINENKCEAQKIVESAMIEYYTEEPIWALEEKHTKDVFGFIKIDNYSPKNKICNISWAMVGNYCNEKLITQALRKVMKYLFYQRGIELIECSYYEQNKETGDILDNVGMKKEAVLKQRRFNEQTNKKEDYIIYSIDINEFKNLKLCGI